MLPGEPLSKKTVFELHADSTLPAIHMGSGNSVTWKTARKTIFLQKKWIFYQKDVD